jgi:heat shock protein HtpX
MLVFLLLTIAIGFLVSQVFGSPVYLYIAVFLSIAINIYAYWNADKMVLRMAGAKQIESRQDYPELWNSVENLSITAGLPMPKLYVIDDPAPNAFATGRDPQHAVIAVTTGLLPLLTKSELEGVLAHELSHIGNRDMLVSTVVVVFAGLISIVADMLMRASFFGGDRDRAPFTIVFALLAGILAPLAATIIQLAVSRQREFLADASGALLTRYPDGLASALQKIEDFPQALKIQNSAIAHLYISNPLGGAHSHDEEMGGKKVSFLAKLFMTHPPTSERIAALRSQK